MKNKIYVLISIMIIVSVILAACTAGGSENTEEAVNTSGEPTIAEEVSSNLETESSTDETKESSTTEKATEKATEKVTEKATESTTKKQSTTQRQTTTEKKETTTKKTTTTQKQTTTQQYGSNWATKEDEKAIADKVIYYINKYRKEEGHVTATKLPGLTKYCEYRSRQLVNNYDHDTDDQRAAAASLKYGYYYADRGYYSTASKEAIVKCIGSAATALSVDEVAKQMADSFRNSQGHWRYVGATQKADDFYNSEYIYIACGVTYTSEGWYCCVAVSDLNTDEMTRLQIEPNEFLDQTYGQN